jgi:hypothetical protein
MMPGTVGRITTARMQGNAGAVAETRKPFKLQIGKDFPHLVIRRMDEHRIWRITPRP